METTLPKPTQLPAPARHKRMKSNDTPYPPSPVSNLTHRLIKIDSVPQITFISAYKQINMDEATKRRNNCGKLTKPGNQIGLN